MTTAEKTQAQGIPPALRMTESEFEAWVMRQENVRAEWVEGEVVFMSPVNLDHSHLVDWLGRLLGFYVAKHDLGTLISSEYVTRLKGRRRVPDLQFISKEREQYLTRTYLQGAPDLAIEVVSPDSESRDWRDKYLEYEANGVREYWVIDPASPQAEFYALKDGKFVRIAETEGVVRSEVLAGFWLKIEWLWTKPLPNVYKTAKAVGII